MRITPENPIIKPAVAEAAYDHYWMVSMQINAQNPNGKVSVSARLVPARDVTVDGVTTKELNRDNFVNVNIPDLFARIQADPTGPLAQAFVAIFNALVPEIPGTSIVN